MCEIDVSSENVEVDEDYVGYMQYGDGAWISIVIQGLMVEVMVPLDNEDEP